MSNSDLRNWYTCYVLRVTVNIEEIRSLLIIVEELNKENGGKTEWSVRGFMLTLLLVIVLSLFALPMYIRCYQK